MSEKRAVTVWMGFVDRKPHFFREYVKGWTHRTWVATLYRSRSRAKHDYEDV